jgi:hypothetical protein
MVSSIFDGFLSLTSRFIGFPWLTSFGKLDEEYGFIAMDLLGANSLEVLRKLEQRKSSERYYGFPLAAIAAIAVKLVSLECG